MNELHQSDPISASFVSPRMNKLKVYRSSAGSGKTYTLVKEFLLLILSKSDAHYYRRILAVTFTNKAATELKERIVNHLLGLSEIAPELRDKSMMIALKSALNLSDQDVQERSAKIIEHMLYHYGELSVGTIDKFVVRILRYFSKELGINADFSIELDTKQMMELTVARTLERIGIDKDLTDISLDYARFKSSRDKSWKIKTDLVELSYFLKSEKSVEAVKYLTGISEIDFKNYVSGLKKNLNITSNALKKELKNAQEIVETANDIALKNVYSNIVKYVAKVASAKSPEGMLASPALSKSIESEVWHKKGTTQVNIEEVEALKLELQPVLHRLIENIINLFTNQELLGTYIPLIFSKKILEVSEEIKEEQNLLMISDNNQMISNIIEDNPSPYIYEKIGDYYKHFFIDEFQDTSITQWHNMIPLVEESLAYDRSNVIVGDSKQSIYRFRGGEMEQLSSLPKIYEGRDRHIATESVFTSNISENFLASNYRSREEVVQFNNELYDFLKREVDERFKVIYKQHDQLPVRGVGGMVSINRMEFEKDEDKDERLLTEIMSSIEISLEKGFDYEDIAILVYKNNVGQLIAEHLKSKGIPIVSAESLLLNQHQDVQFLIAFITNLIRRSEDQCNLTIVQFLYEKNQPDTQFEEFLATYLPRGDKFEKIYTDLGFEYDKNHYLSLPLFSIVEQLCKDFNIDSSDAYVVEFLNLTYKFSIEKAGSISEFLDFWDIKKHKVALKISDSFSAVKILTVHSAKGLEFPVVINPYYFKKTRKTSERYIWAVEPTDEMPVKLVPTKDLMLRTKYADLVNDEIAKTSIDQMNTLYVATTRSTEMLFLILPAASKESIKRSPDKMENKINAFCMEAIDNGNSALLWGDGTGQKRSEKADKSSSLVWTNYPKIAWRKKLRIAISDQLKSEELAYGNTLHNVLAEIVDLEDRKVVMEKYAQKHLLRAEDLKKVIAHVDAIFEIEEVKKWHEESDEIFSEREIISAEGDLLRPDRVFILSDKVIVLDYKTGVENNRNLKQVESYCAALIEMGYTSVSGYLLYSQTMKLVKVD